jgi:hypothetical protein
MQREAAVIELMQSICDVAARGVYRYCEVAGQIGGTYSSALFMPESFVPAFVLDRLGTSCTISLETNYKNLEDFCGLASGALRQNQRVDMVVYESDPAKRIEDRAPMLLVEFKLLTPFSEDGSDRQKLFEILNRVDSSLYGAVCAVLDSNKVDLSRKEARALADGDSWYQCDVGRLPHGNAERLSVCARLFYRRNIATG